MLIFFYFILLSLINPHIYSNQKNYQNFAIATYNYRCGNIKSAQKYFDIFFQSNEHNHQALKEYLSFLFETKQYSKFESTLSTNIEMFKNDEQIQLFHTTILKKLGAKKQARSIYQNLSKNFPQSQEVAYEAIVDFVENKNFKEALECLQNLFKNNFNSNSNYVFHVIACKIYIGLGKIEAAKKSIETALKLYPQSSEGWLMFALINQELNDINDAIHGYNRFLDITGNNKLIESELLKLKLKQNLLSKSNFSQSLSAYNSKDYNKALIYIEKALKDDSKSMESKLLKVEILITLKDTPAALNIISKEIESGENEKIWLELLYIIFENIKDKNLVSKTLKQILKERQKDLLINLYGADIFFKLNDTNNGIKYAKKAFKNTNDILLKSKIIFEISKIYYKNKDYTKLGAILDKNILTKTDYGPLLNLAAYYFATKGKNLELAENLSMRALKSAPQNAHYLDTKAKILYKQKKYKESLEILEKAAKLLPEDKFIKINLEKSKNKLDKST